MTGLRGARWTADRGRFRVTPDDATSQEARLELSSGVDSPKRARGGAPIGGRSPLRPLPHPTVRLIQGCAYRRSASLLLREELGRAFLPWHGKARMRTHRENGFLLRWW